MLSGGDYRPVERRARCHPSADGEEEEEEEEEEGDRKQMTGSTDPESSSNAVTGR